MNSTRADERREAAEARRAAIRDCLGCDSEGWELGPGRVPADPARKCRHGEDPHARFDARRWR